jgi:heterodisulfide reductase subunit C
MPEFGYKITKDRQIDYDKNDKNLFLTVAKLEPSIYQCISCGTCAATCSAGQFTNYSLRKMILLLKRGEDKEVITTISKCMLCGKCQLACPMGVNTRNLILCIQNAIKNTTTHEV